MIFKSLVFASLLWAEPWESHQEQIQLIEKQMYKFEKELNVLVERKKSSHDQVRIHETLDRILEIHAELIGLREKMDEQKIHLEKEHPDKAHILKHFDARLIKSQIDQREYTRSELSGQLDQLLIKIKMKYSHLAGEEKAERDLAEMNALVSEKKEQKKNRKAETYLRERSDIKLSK